MLDCLFEGCSALMYTESQLAARSPKKKAIENTLAMFHSKKIPAVSSQTTQWAGDLNPRSDDYASKITDRLFATAAEHTASDLHLDSTADGLVIRMRAKGLLSLLANVPYGQTSHVIARIKSLAGLLAYRTDVPQEGRIGLASGGDARVCTLPTLHGERLVIRFSVSQTQHWELADLGLPDFTLNRVVQAIDSASGVMLVCGPAGSGKTTTAYAMLQRLAKADSTIRRCLVSLEDPIEQVIDGVSQSQIQPGVGFDWAAGLKAVLRQDPEVMLIGEIRDAQTARIVFQAASTGQLVLSTMHARGVGDAITRLVDMEVPKHQILSSLLLLIVQRLVRANTNTLPSRDRLLLVEELPCLEDGLRESILAEVGAEQLEHTARSHGMRSLRDHAIELFGRGDMDEITFRRHFQSK